MKFIFDATSAIKPGAENRIAIRLVSILNEPIDGMVRAQTPHGGYAPFNLGGIFDNVELLMTPQVRMEDLFVRADPKTGKMRIEAEIRNESPNAVQSSINYSVAPAAGGEAVCAVNLNQKLQPGVNTISTELQLENPQLWQLNDPFLYRLTGRISAEGSKSISENTARFGFRDFRFENGYFRLNGKRVFWRSVHTGADAPGSIRLPHDPDLLRRDLLDLKVMGFNGVRFISIMPPRYQLDLCDEIGLMVYEESHASWMLQDSPQLAERMDRTLTGMVLRDRNHPSIVMWGLLNETGQGGVFQHAAASLPLMRRLDDSRIIMLGSGRFDAGERCLNGLEIWKPENGIAPCLTHNPKTYGLCAIALWRPNEVALLPGVGAEYSTARWTAPADGDYTITAKFRGSGHFTVSDVHILQNDKPIHESFINRNGCGDVSIYRGTLQLAKGQTLDFIVGGSTPAGGEWFQRWSNNTTLAVTIAASDGKKLDLADDFTSAKNPNGPWSYGWLAAGPKPDVSTFKPYAQCETKNADALGSLSNPGSDHWEDVLADTHYYPRVPHRELEIARLRTFAGNDHSQFLSEYGVGSAVDLPRYLRQCEQVGMESSEMANQIRQRQAAFMDAWDRLKLADTFVSPENYFALCVARMAYFKRIGLNAIRSNPKIVAHNMTGGNDPVGFGEGQITAFRELKPGTVDAIFEGFYPVKWCTFAEPVHIYRGAKVHLEAVLANEDAVSPGQYPARLEVVGPDNQKVLSRSITVTIPGVENGKEPAFAIPVFSEEVPIDGPSGKYRFMVTFEKGIAASGGQSEFYVTDPADMPAVESKVALWGDDRTVADWLKNHGMKTYPYKPGRTNNRQVILVSNAPAGDGGTEAWRDLAARISEGSTAVFLTLDIFKKGDDPLGWLPLARKGAMGMVSEYWFPQLYLKDEWVKKHPLFDGLPCGGLMDDTFYREIIPDYRYWGQEIPEEPVAGAIRTSCSSYHSELTLSVYKLGEGRFILNSLRVRPELGQDPTAERLLRNMLRYAAKDAEKPTAPVQPNQEEFFKSLEY
jgi:hypothetical protein